jgi:RimJ/RimL family protein N-acetyltransferase
MNSQVMDADGTLANARPLDWKPVAPPGRVELRGEHVLLRPVRVEDAGALFEVGDDAAIFTYLPYGPYETADHLREHLAQMVVSEDPLFFVLCPLPDAKPRGIASYLRIEPQHGVIEIGHIWFGTTLQRTMAATEAIFLLARHAFDDLGYRRLEWKCDSLNERSRAAAARFGFTYEGVFRNHMVVKGRNRDSAWFAITREDWPAIRSGFERWLAPENRDARGQQRESLARMWQARP